MTRFAALPDRQALLHSLDQTTGPFDVVVVNLLPAPRAGAEAPTQLTEEARDYFAGGLVALVGELGLVFSVDDARCCVLALPGDGPALKSALETHLQLTDHPLARTFSPRIGVDAFRPDTGDTPTDAACRAAKQSEVPLPVADVRMTPAVGIALPKFGGHDDDFVISPLAGH